MSEVLGPKFKLPLSYVKNQNGLKICTGCAMATAVEAFYGFEASPLFIYNNSISSFGQITIANAISSVSRFGVCSEKLWSTTAENFKVKPSKEAFAEAKRYTIGSAIKLVGSDQVLDALRRKWPCLFSYDVNLLTSLGLHVNNESSPLHVSVIFGYDICSKVFNVRQSWGREWNGSGDFELPWSNFNDLRYNKSCIAITPA